MIAVLNWSLDHWYVFFWLAILGVFEGVRDFFLGIFAAIVAIGERRHERRIEEIRAAAPAPPVLSSSLPKPGPCVHRNVTAVISGGDEVVGWLCRSCDTQLPADWAVREEDL
ncbi:MAG TPA: hypothetical protein VGS62_02330 [Streptosporangiaceae bacterium]|nr:hypothetical protein [Streptosporangiaceae bacterium]